MKKISYTPKSWTKTDLALVQPNSLPGTKNMSNLAMLLELAHNFLLFVMEMRKICSKCSQDLGNNNTLHNLKCNRTTQSSTSMHSQKET